MLIGAVAMTMLAVIALVTFMREPARHAFHRQREMLTSFVTSSVAQGSAEDMADTVRRILGPLSEDPIFRGGILVDAKQRFVCGEPKGFNVPPEIFKKVWQEQALVIGDDFYSLHALRDVDGMIVGHYLSAFSMKSLSIQETKALIRALAVGLPFLMIFLGLLVWQVGLELSMRAEEKTNRLRADVLSRVSHEFRTPLTSMKCVTEILKHVGPEEEMVRKDFLEIVGLETLRLQALVDEVLHFSALQESGYVPPVSKMSLTAFFAKKVHDWSKLTEAACIDFTFELCEDDYLAKVDAEYMEGLMDRLLSNAIKFTPEQGSVRLVVEPSTGGKVTVAVLDSGPGVPEDERERIFEPLHQMGDILTGKPDGLGLGLSICRHLVENMGGRIWCEGSALGGAAFKFELAAEIEHPRAREKQRVELSSV